MKSDWFHSVENKTYSLCGNASRYNFFVPQKSLEVTGSDGCSGQFECVVVCSSARSTSSCQFECVRYERVSRTRTRV